MSRARGAMGMCLTHDESLICITALGKGSLRGCVACPRSQWEKGQGQNHVGATWLQTQKFTGCYWASWGWRKKKWSCRDQRSGCWASWNENSE